VAKRNKQIAWRIVAVFGYSAMSIVGGASIIGGIPVWKAALLAGISACAQVIEKLARAYADDGVITDEELNAAFALTGKEKDNGTMPYDYEGEPS
jgi:hypothetical protein